MFSSKFLLLLVVFAQSLTIAYSQKVWHNPEKAPFNPIEGQYWQDKSRENFYCRIPDMYEDSLRSAVWNLSLDCAGETIKFRTNSKKYYRKICLAQAH